LRILDDEEVAVRLHFFAQARARSSSIPLILETLHESTQG